MLSLILVIEDDLEIQAYLKEQLIANNFSVKTSSTGTSALTLLKKSEPDLVLLDLRLPDIGGESIFRQLRLIHPNLPVIFLTAANSPSDITTGLNIGADDYITKPFEIAEVIARIHARLRSKSPLSTILTVADLTLDPQKVQVSRAGKTIILTPQEFKLLEYLMQNPGQVLSREAILNRIWLLSPDVESRVVDVYIGYLRKKVDSGFSKQLIHSVRGFGYTLKV